MNEIKNKKESPAVYHPGSDLQTLPVSVAVQTSRPLFLKYFDHMYFWCFFPGQSVYLFSLCLRSSTPAPPLFKTRPASLQSPASLVSPPTTPLRALLSRTHPLQPNHSSQAFSLLSFFVQNKLSKAFSLQVVSAFGS